MRAVAPTRVILVVEDEHILRSDIVAQFEDHGWSVLDAPTGEAALALLRDHHVDVVFTDIQLPGAVNGWDVAEFSRAARADVPVIYTSGNSADRSRRVSGSLFFDKPYNPLAVVEACRKLPDQAT